MRVSHRMVYNHRPLLVNTINISLIIFIVKISMFERLWKENKQALKHPSSAALDQRYGVQQVISAFVKYNKRNVFIVIEGCQV